MKPILILDCFERDTKNDFRQVTLEELPPSELTAYHVRYRVKSIRRQVFKTEDEARAAFRKSVGKSKTYNDSHHLN